jgi:rare lipoprotein A
MRALNLVLLFLSLFWLASCSSVKTQPSPPAPPAVKSADTTSPNASQAQKSGQATNKGGYYLDDGPADNPPSDINSIPNAVPKHEPYLTRSNKPYTALGQRYVPMTSYQPYKKQGIATWYGKRYHGRQTSSGVRHERHDGGASDTTHPKLRKSHECQ